MSAMGALLNQVEVGRLGVRLGAGIGLPPVEERRHAVALGMVELLGRPEVARQIVVHLMKAAVEGLGGLVGFQPSRHEVMRRRITFVVTRCARAEARRERFAGFRCHEGRRRPCRSHGLLVALGDGALCNAAGLWVEAVEIPLDSRRYSNSRRPRSKPFASAGGGWNCDGSAVILALVGVVFLAGRDLAERKEKILARRGVAFIHALVVPATLGIAAGRHPGLLDGRPDLA